MVQRIAETKICLYPRITVLLLLVQVTLSIKPSDEQLFCDHVPAKGNFDFAYFFQGNWYVTHAYDPNGSPKANLEVCLNIKSELLRTVVRQLYTFYYPQPQQLRYAEGFVGLGSFNPKVGRFSCDLRQISKEGKPLSNNFIRLTETIVETDYDNYAVIYLCMPGIGTTYAVLSRVPDAQKVHPHVGIILQRLGFNLNIFSSIKDVNCPKYEYELN